VTDIRKPPPQYVPVPQLVIETMRHLVSLHDIVSSPVEGRARGAVVVAGRIGTDPTVVHQILRGTKRSVTPQRLIDMIVGLDLIGLVEEPEIPTRTTVKTEAA
jgi:hypothetical protein